MYSGHSEEHLMSTTTTDPRRDDFWNTAALVTLLAVMACIASASVIVAVASHVGGGQLEAVVSLGGLLISGGLVAVIIYLLVNPLHDPAPRISPSYAGATGRADEYSTLAVVAFVASFITSIPGIILGHLALREIQRTGRRGRGLAVAALIIGYVLLFIGVLFWVLIIVLAHS
jgi:hypothetical protein